MRNKLSDLVKEKRQLEQDFSLKTREIKTLENKILKVDSEIKKIKDYNLKMLFSKYVNHTYMNSNGAIIKFIKVEHKNHKFGYSGYVNSYYKVIIGKDFNVVGVNLFDVIDVYNGSKRSLKQKLLYGYHKLVTVKNSKTFDDLINNFKQLIIANCGDIDLKTISSVVSHIKSDEIEKIKKFYNEKN